MKDVIAFASEAARQPRWRWVWAAVVVLMLGYAVFLGANFAPVAAGSDSGGYYNAARLLLKGEFSTPMRKVPEFNVSWPWTYTPLGFSPDGPLPGLKPTYPIGLPLHYAVAASLAGWHWGPLVISVLGCLAAVGLTYALARELGGETLMSLLGGATLALSAMFLYISFIPMSDTIATAWCTAAFLGAIKAKKSWRWAALSGFAFSMAVLVRPTNILFGPPIALMLWPWKNWMVAALGALPGATWQAYYSRVVYGSIFKTGYGSMSDAFQWEHVPGSWANYVKTYPWVLPVVIPALVLIGLLPWKARARDLIGLAVALGTMVVFYSFYVMTPLVWWYLRFLLPVFPIIIAFGVLGMQRLLERRRVFAYSWSHYATIAAVLIVSVYACVSWGRKQHIMLMKPFQRPYREIGEYAATKLPKDSLLLCMQVSSAIYFYTDLPLVRWDLAQDQDIPTLKEALEKSHRPVYATILQFEREDLMKRYPWNWVRVDANVQDIEVWKLDYKVR